MAFDFKLKREKRYRLILEFTATDQLETLLEKIGDSLDNGTLIINGEWSWGAEAVETFVEDKGDD